MKVTTLLRAPAIVVAVLAVVDPTITRSRGGQVTVAVVSADPAADSAQIVNVRNALGSGFTVIAGPFAKADASVIVGDAMPANVRELATPVFRANPSGASVSIERLDAPRTASPHSRIAVTPRVHLRGANERAAEVTLRANGVVVATATARATGNDAHVDVPLSFAPGAGDVAAISVTATLGAADSASADAVIDLKERPWRILFRDGRPSWTSTFVRRAIERDPRFEVASRIGMTASVASDAGSPSAALDSYDVIVLGAPSSLAKELPAIEPYLRRRGGSVVVLPDEFSPTNLPPVIGTQAAIQWSGRQGGPALPIGTSRADSSSLRAIEMAWPVKLPDGANVIAWANVARNDTTRRAIVWSTHVGAGHVVVSGALDAWRFRDAASSSFDSFWRDVIAAEAARAAKPIELTLAPQSTPDERRLTLSVTLRSPAIAGATSDAPMSASLRADLNDTPIRLWPAATVGTFTAELTAPEKEGTYAVRVISGRDTASAPLLVKSGSRSAKPDASGFIAAYASATGGGSVNVGELARSIRAAVKPGQRSEPWNPMRNPLWIIPFALLLSAEWWARRRTGKV